MHRYSLHPANTDDLPQLEALVNSAYRGDEARKGWTHEADLIEGSIRTNAEELKLLIQKKDAVILTCKQSQQILGCVYLEKKGQRLYLGMLSVSPGQQGKGIGKVLLQAAEEYAIQKQCNQIEMSVISIRHELIDWYERHGYTNTFRTLPFHNDGRFGKPRKPVEFIIMEKQLTTTV
jgi:ribosomal protein S18 acetylase RimI-like enzyme